MSDKLEVLLKLNKIMKQQAEKSLADCMRIIRQLSDEVSDIHHNIQQKNTALFKSAETSFIQSDMLAFEHWKAAQLKQVITLREKLKTAEQAKVGLVQELKTQTVRQDMLRAQQKQHQALLAEERDEMTNERNLEGWLNQQRYA